MSFRCNESFLEQYQLGQHLFRKHKIVANSVKTGLHIFSVEEQASAVSSPDVEDTGGPSSVHQETQINCKVGQTAMVEVDSNLNVEIESPAVNGFSRERGHVDADSAEPSERRGVDDVSQETGQAQPKYTDGNETCQNSDEIELLDSTNVNAPTGHGEEADNIELIERPSADVVSSKYPDLLDSDEIELIETLTVTKLNDETSHSELNVQPSVNGSREESHKMELIESPTLTGVCHVSQLFGTPSGNEDGLEADDIILIESLDMNGVTRVVEPSEGPIDNTLSPDSDEIQVIENPGVTVGGQEMDPSELYDRQGDGSSSVISIDLNGNAMGESEQEGKVCPQRPIQKCPAVPTGVPDHQMNGVIGLSEETHIEGDMPASEERDIEGGDTNEVVMGGGQAEKMEMTYSEDAEMNEAIMLLTELKDATITEPEENNEDDIQEVFTESEENNDEDDVHHVAQAPPTEPMEGKDETDIEEVPQAGGPMTDIEEVPQAGGPMTDIEEVPQAGGPMADIEEVPPAERPMTDIEAVPPAERPMTDIEAVPPAERPMTDIEAVPPAERPMIVQHQSSLKLTMMTDDDSRNSTAGGDTSDNTQYMLRGDPSLHQCPSREDLCLFEETSALSEDEKGKNPGELSTLAPTWSNSCTSLSGLVMTTPHKLSVDPGATSLNTSPAASPFRATIGRGDSEAEEDSIVDALAEKCRKNPGKVVIVLKKDTEPAGPGMADKESSISPGHTEASNDLPLQPTSITYLTADEGSAFQDLKNITQGDPTNVGTVIGELRLITQNGPCTNTVPNNLLTGTELPESDTSVDSNGKSVRRRSARARRSIQWSDKIQIKKSKEWTANDESRCATVVLERFQPSQILRLQAGFGHRPARKRKKRRDDHFDYNYGKQTRQKRPASEEPKPVSKRRRKSHNTSQDSFVDSADSEWSPEASDTMEETDMESHCSSDSERVKNSLEDKKNNPEEYNLRPKRRKSFQVLLNGCECVLDEGDKLPNHAITNLKRYEQFTAKVLNLRSLVTRMIKTVFPDLAYPSLFQEDGLCVEYLMDEIMDACGERQRKVPLSAPFGNVGDKVKVVLCKYPFGCLRHLRRKTVRLLKTLLPDIKSEGLDPGRMNALLEEVIQTNLTAAAVSAAAAAVAVEQPSNQKEPT